MSGRGGKVPFGFEEEWAKRGRYRELVVRRARNMAGTTRPAGPRIPRSKGGANNKARQRPPTAGPSRETVLKVLSWGKSRSAARRMLDYVARAREEDGQTGPKPVLRDEAGEVLTLGQAHARLGGPAELDGTGWGMVDDRDNLSPEARALAPILRSGLDEQRRLRRRQVVHISFSIGGTDSPRERLALEAGTARAVQEIFGANGFPVAWAVHDDHGRSHAHLIVGTQTRPDELGRRKTLRLGPEALAEIRQRFTERVADLGVEVVATRRLERGEVRQSVMTPAPRPLSAKGIDRGRPPDRTDGAAAISGAPGVGAIAKLSPPGLDGQVAVRAPGYVVQHADALRAEVRAVIQLEAEEASAGQGREGSKRPRVSPRGRAFEDLFERVHVDPQAARERYAELETELSIREDTGRLADWYLANRPEIFGAAFARWSPAGQRQAGQILAARRRELEPGPRRIVRRRALGAAEDDREDPAEHLADRDRRVRDQEEIAGSLLWQLRRIRSDGWQMLGAFAATSAVLDDHITAGGESVNAEVVLARSELGGATADQGSRLAARRVELAEAALLELNRLADLEERIIIERSRSAQGADGGLGRVAEAPVPEVPDPRAEPAERTSLPDNSHAQNENNSTSRTRVREGREDR